MHARTDCHRGGVHTTAVASDHSNLVVIHTEPGVSSYRIRTALEVELKIENIQEYTHIVICTTKIYRLYLKLYLFPANIMGQINFRQTRALSVKILVLNLPRSQ